MIVDLNFHFSTINQYRLFHLIEGEEGEEGEGGGGGVGEVDSWPTELDCRSDWCPGPESCSTAKENTLVA